MASKCEDEKVKVVIRKRERGRYGGGEEEREGVKEGSETR